MRDDNQSKKMDYEVQLDAFLCHALEENIVEVVNGRVSRSWLRNNINCGANWLNQNPFAKKKIMEVESKLRESGIRITPKASPGIKDKEVRLMMARVERLEQRNAHLLEENSRYKTRLYEFGWIESDEEESVQGRLPW